MMQIKYHSDGTLTVEGMELSRDGIKTLYKRLAAITPDADPTAPDAPTTATLQRDVPNSYRR